MNQRSYWKLTLTVIIAIFCASVALLAQELEDEKLEIYDLERLAIEEIPIEENIMPTSRPFNSVYGTNRSILDTPRNVTIISREQLDAIAIKDVRDFSKLTSSSYTRTNFGAPTTPNLRGQEADLFVNGMRRGGSVNGNGLPINFNAVESVNIVKGPAGVVYGTTNYLGGYADLITKKPFFDGPHGEVAISVGDFNQYTWNLDYGAPFNEGKTAWRVSYEGKEWDGYWQFWKQNSHAIYFALTHKPSETYTIEANIEFFFANYTENWGINRVTQDLVDRGEYIPNRQTDAEYANYVKNILGNGNNMFGGGRAGVDFASQFGDPGFATIIPVASNTIPVNRRWKLAAPGDDSRGKFIFGGIDQTWELASNRTLVNKTAFSYKDRETFSSYHYSEYMKDNILFENRTELRISGEDFAGDGSFNINMGVRFRYDDIWAVNHFFNEPVNFWDMARDPNLRRVPDQGFAGAPYVFDKEPRGVLKHWYIGPDVFADIPTLTGGDTITTNIGPFIQGDMVFNDYFSLLMGATVDFLKAEVKHPVLGANDTFDFNGDGEIAANQIESGFVMKERLSLVNYNISPLLKVNENTSLYFTINYSETYPVETGGRPVIEQFGDSQASVLNEFGAKWLLLDGKLFIGAALVDRKFTERNQDGSVDDVFIDAYEIEFNYQPNRKLFMTFGFSLIDAERTGGFFASSYTIDRALAETGGLYISPVFQGAPDGALVKAPGVPDKLINALFQYKWENGFGLMANFLGWGELNSGYEGFDISVPDLTDGFIPFANSFDLTANTVTLPFQHEIDMSAFYEYEDWEFKITAFNISDEENWDVNNSGYGNGSIVTRMPFRLEATIKKRF